MLNKEKRHNEARKQPEKQLEREKSSEKCQGKSAGKREQGEKDLIERQKYASDVRRRQESVYVQLLLLIIQLNAVVGDEPLEAYALCSLL